MLSFVQNLRQNYDTARTHARAIAQMLKLRGGPLQIDVSLRMKVYRYAALQTDVHRLSSSLTNRGPCRADLLAALSTLSLPILEEFPISQLPMTLSLEHRPIHPSFFSDVTSRQLMTVLCEIYHLGCCLEQAIDQAEISLPPTSFDEHTIRIKQQLLRLHLQEILEVELAVCLGALIYVDVGLRRTEQVPETVSTAFLSILHRIVSHGRITPPLSIWLFFIGLFGAQLKSYQQQWLLSNILQSTRSLEVEVPKWSRVQMELKKSLWVDSILDPMGRTIWTEAGSKQHDAHEAAAATR